MKSEKQTPPALRHALCAIILSLSLTAVYTLSPRFISQIYYTKARRFQKDGHLKLALENYQKAVAYQNRDVMARKGLAEIMLNKGMKEESAQEAFYYTQNARDEFVHAYFYNPIDAETAYGLARSENRLEQLYQDLHPEEKNNPYDALPYFEKAIRLRPNSIMFQYAMARYLYQHGDQEELLKSVRIMARIYPEAYRHLKKEPFWSPSVKAAVKQGFMDAMKQKMLIARAHMAISTMLVDDNEWEKAISHYQKALEYKEGNISAQDYINLGRLFLQNNQIKEAQLNFIKSLYVSQSIEKTFSDIGRVFIDTNQIDSYYAFYKETNERFLLSTKMHVASARYLIDQKQYFRARRILTDLNKQNPEAEAYYWLARIAEIEKDDDAMEINIQKATVLDPSNMTYRQMFYNLLKRLGKHVTAEREVDLMIQNSENPSPRLFDERAKFRRNRNDYAGAVEDWKSAIRLAPQNAVFHANIAEAYMKLGNLSQALEYYRKAAQLDPGNQSYVGKYKKLKGESS